MLLSTTFSSHSSVKPNSSTASSIYTSELSTYISDNEEPSTATQISEATNKTGKIYQSGFVQGFKAQNSGDVTDLGEEILFVDPETGNDRGDIDFAVVVTRAKALREFFAVSCFMLKEMGDIVVPVGCQIFLELTSMDGKGVMKCGRVQSKYSFYQNFVAGSFKPKASGAPVWKQGDIVIFAYNGVDHVSIEKEVEQLNAGFIFVPVWLPKNVVAAWEATIHAQRAQDEAQRAQDEAQRARAVIRQLLVSQGKSEDEISSFLATL
ncbi:hypothetical protein HK097_010608 [Rhizophlyctis rosea]|uniref:Uncharacterized protein n=1 Tax=Rhizophlyctis rosea TaxID=64517 RepID=A0AAD5SI14_9FUNG|nr:hypothetical protein HK097_010608 [Rhizophlyctis rosea]